MYFLLISLFALFHQIVSKGSILRVAEHEANDIHPTVTTIAIPLSPDMAPVFQLVVFTKTQNGYIVADGLMMPVDGFDRYEAGCICYFFEPFLSTFKIQLIFFILNEIFYPQCGGIPHYEWRKIF